MTGTTTTGTTTTTGSGLRMVDNTDRDRFELWDGQTFLGLLAYERVDGTLRLMHTVIEERYGHMGIARLLVTLVLTRVRLDNGRIDPVCSYVHRYLTRFPEYRVLLARN